MERQRVGDGVTAESIAGRLRELRRLKASGIEDVNERVLRIYLEAEKRLCKIDRVDRDKARRERVEPVVPPLIIPPSQVTERVSAQPDQSRPSEPAVPTVARIVPGIERLRPVFSLPARLPSLAWVKRELSEGATPVYYRVLDAYAVESLSTPDRLAVTVIIPPRPEPVAEINRQYDLMVVAERFRPKWEGRRVYFSFVYR